MKKSGIKLEKPAPVIIDFRSGYRLNARTMPFVYMLSLGDKKCIYIFDIYAWNHTKDVDSRPNIQLVVKVTMLTCRSMCQDQVGSPSLYIFIRSTVSLTPLQRNW